MHVYPQGNKCRIAVQFPEACNTTAVTKSSDTSEYRYDAAAVTAAARRVASPPPAYVLAATAVAAAAGFHYNN